MLTRQSETRSFVKGLLMFRLRRKQLRLVQSLCFFALLTICFMYLFTNSFTYSSTGKHVIYKYTNVHFRRKAIKKILMWLPHANKDVVRLENECLKTCPVKCIVTGEKHDIAEVDAIDFHLSNLWTEVWSIGTRSIIDFPKYRRPDQIWIVSNMDRPPQNLWGDIAVFNGVFNWTRWYRTDATIMWPYGFPYRFNATERSEAVRAFSGQNIFKRKTKNIVGRVSNCNAPNRRLSTIKRMGRYIKIDMQGACFGNPCGTPGDETDTKCSKSLQDYKFFLAFENNNCADYVTEKYWYTLKREQIPIVNWKRANRDIVIPGSYINIYDFENIQTAMEYVKKVAENESLYNSYFDWRLSYADRGICSSCEICKRLHDTDRPAQVIADLDAWVRNDTCGKMGIKGEIQKYIYRYLGI